MKTNPPARSSSPTRRKKPRIMLHPYLSRAQCFDFDARIMARRPCLRNFGNEKDTGNTLIPVQLWFGCPHGERAEPIMRVPNRHTGALPANTGVAPEVQPHQHLIGLLARRPPGAV